MVNCLTVNRLREKRHSYVRIYFKCDHRTFSYRKVGTAPKPKPRAKHPYKVMVWAGISRKGATNASVNSAVYQEVLRAHLLPFLRRKLPKTITRFFVLIVTCSPFSGPLLFFSLLSFDAASKYSFPSYLDDPLPSYLISTFSTIYKSLHYLRERKDLSDCNCN